MMGEHKVVTRREAMKTALKGSAYAVPVALGTIVPTAVAAASPPPPRTTVTFAAAPGSPFAVSGFPFEVVVGDFNGDRKPDLAIVSSGTNAVFVLLGTGTGIFTAVPGSPIAVGTFPYGIAAADFNGDGRLDLAVTNNASKTVSILLGNGSGGFTNAPGSPFSAGGGARDIAVGDFNGDGKIDLAIVDAVGKVDILIGTGTGGFGPSPTPPITVGANPSGIAVGDFNGDGKLDLAVTNGGSNTVSVLLGNGTGAFTGPTSVTVDAQPIGIVAGDFNSDGRLDLAVANNGGNTVSVLLGNGTGGFTNAPGSPFAVGMGPFAIATGDFNGDGKLDLAVANDNGNSVSVLLGAGTGAFTNIPASPIVGFNGPEGIAVGDFNGDGKLDLVVTNTGGTTVSVLLQQ